jgi:predicted kinase
MADLLIVTGPTGVGKSTTSRVVAGSVDKSAHIRIDDFTRFVVNGWVEPWLPAAGQQNDVLGRAVVAAAMQFTSSGYTVVVDGTVFTEPLAELALACAQRDVALHYAVLRCDAATCFDRAVGRGDGERPDAKLLADLHAKFDDVGAYEGHVVDASGTPDEVAAAVLAAFRSGKLAIPSR